MEYLQKGDKITVICRDEISYHGIFSRIAYFPIPGGPVCPFIILATAVQFRGPGIKDGYFIRSDEASIFVAQIISITPNN